VRFNSDLAASRCREHDEVVETWCTYAFESRKQEENTETWRRVGEYETERDEKHRVNPGFLDVGYMYFNNRSGDSLPHSSFLPFTAKVRTTPPSGSSNFVFSRFDNDGLPQMNPGKRIQAKLSQRPIIYIVLNRLIYYLEYYQIHQPVCVPSTQIKGSWLINIYDYPSTYLSELPHPESSSYRIANHLW